MEIIKLTVGENEDLDISFAEGKFSVNDETFFVYAISTGELILLAKSDVSIGNLQKSIEEEVELDLYAYNSNSWIQGSKTISNKVLEFDLESILAYCMENEFECYQCWRHDGNEGLCEAAESDSGTAFVIVYDLITESDFPNTRELLAGNEEDEILLATLDEISF